MGAILFLIVTIPLARLVDWLIAREQTRYQSGNSHDDSPADPSLASRRPAAARELTTRHGEPILGCDEIHKSFGDLEVLEGVDLTVNRGEVVCMLGPSGSGKSTLLRCINLLEPPDGGRIVLEGRRDHRQGRPRTELDFVRQRVGMVFQQFNLFPHMTALENVTLAPETGARPLAKDGAPSAARSCSTRVGLADKLERVPRPPLRRPAAAGRDRPGAGDGAAA